jgi:surfactin family lipopeptide synthetase A
MSTAKRILDLSPDKREALNALLQRGASRHNRAIARCNLRKDIPLSPAQERLWFAEQWQPGLAVYNLSAAVPMEPDAGHEAVRRTLREILRRHDILRATFRMNGIGPVQDIRPDIEPDFRVVHIRAEDHT